MSVPILLQTVADVGVLVREVLDVIWMEHVAIEGCVMLFSEQTMGILRLIVI